MQLGPSGSAPGKRHATALLIIDVFSQFDFEDGVRIASRLHERLPAFAHLIGRAREAEAPVVYVNDNWGHWRSQQSELVQQAIDGPPEGAAIARRLRPAPSDYFVLKPRHSGFYGTPLEMLLECLEVSRLVLAGTRTTSSCPGARR